MSPIPRSTVLRTLFSFLIVVLPLYAMGFYLYSWGNQVVSDEILTSGSISRQNAAYNGTEKMPFSKPKFLVLRRME